MEITRGSLEAQLFFREQTQSFGKLGPYNLLDVPIGPKGEANLHWEVECHQLLLGLRTLLSTQDIQADGPAFLNIQDPRIAVGDFGELHVIAATNAGVTLFTQPLMVPGPGVGRDSPPSLREYAELLQRQPAQCYSDPKFQGQMAPRDLPIMGRSLDRETVDIRVTQYVPEILKTVQGRIPTAFDLSDLAERLYHLFRNRPATKGSTDPMELLQEWLLPGSGITLNLSQLEDFQVPGIIDLGPSMARAEVNLEQGGRIRVNLSDFYLNLDPVDYGKGEPGQPSNLRLNGGLVLAAPLYSDGVRPTFVPGLEILWDPATREALVRGNFEIQLELTLPALGSVAFTGYLVLETLVRQTDEGFGLVPGSTLLQIREMDLVPVKGATANLVSAGNITLSDQFADPLSLEALLRPWGDEATGQLTIEGILGPNRDLAVTSDFRIPIADTGLYDFGRFLQNLMGRLQIVTGSPENSLISDLTFETIPAASTKLARAAMGIRIMGNVNASDLKGVDRLLSNAQLEIQYVQSENSQEKMIVSFSADQLSTENLEINQILANLEVNRLDLGESNYQMELADFRFDANQSGSKGGLFQGPIGFRHANGTPTEFQWNGDKRQLQMDELNIEFSSQRIFLPERLLKHLDPSIASWGLDGRLRGHFTMNFPEKTRRWNGRGQILLRGDRQGDVYFLDASGRRVGPALVRDTRWQWRRISRINTDRGYALGLFHLDILVNPAALLNFSDPQFQISLEDIVPHYGMRGQPLKPWEFQAQMPYDNQPYSASGFQNRMVDYLIALDRNVERTQTAKKSEGGTP